MALFLLMFDRNFGTNFFNVDAGGDPLLWQHLFWIFGHPEVYILDPARPSASSSEILPVFSRKPLFGYPFVVFSGIAIGFMGWGVWAHHMFAVGLGPVAVAAFSVVDDAHRRPDRREDLQLARHDVGRQAAASPRRCCSPSASSSMFTIGGLSGVTHAVVAGRHPADRHLLRRRPLPLRAVRRRRLRLLRRLLLLVAEDLRPHAQRDARQVELLADAHRVQPHVRPDAHPRPRRACPGASTPTPSGYGFDLWNLVATIGAFIIAARRAGVPRQHRRARRKQGASRSTRADPWDARTLEWMIPSPPPEHNFDEIPDGHARSTSSGTASTPRTSDGRLVAHRHRPRTSSQQGRRRRDVHLPSPSYWPIVLAFGLPVSATASSSTSGCAVLGALLRHRRYGYGWVMEPSTEPDPAPTHDEGQPSLDSPESAAAELPEADADADGEGDKVKQEEPDELVGASASSDASAKTGDDSND